MEEAPEEAEVEVNTRSWRGVENHSKQAAHSGNGTETGQATDQNLATSGGPGSEGTEQVHPHPNKVELLSDHRATREYMRL